MSALVWSVESAMLGIWALVFSFYSTPFHAFIARSHSMISAFTLILQLITSARDLPISHPISEAFVCAVTALCLVYTASILDTANHKRFFSMPSAGLLPLDAVIGCAWFCAAMTSAFGMALSGVGRGNQRASLMFHQYGYHMSIVLPCFLILWLYNYDASSLNDPVYKGINLARNSGNISITHTLLFTVYSGIWGWFVVAQFLGEGFFTAGQQWSAWQEMDCGTSIAYVLSVMLKFLGRGGCVLIPISAAFAAKTNAQVTMMWVLIGVSGAFAIDLLGFLDKLIGGKTHLPTIDQTDSQPSAPFFIESEFNGAISNEILQQGHSDPAALIINTSAPMLTTATLFQSKQPWRRDKMV